MKLDLDRVYADTLVLKIMARMRSEDWPAFSLDAVVSQAMRYIQVVTDEIARNWHSRSSHDEKLGLYLVSLTRLRRGCGRWGPRGQQHYWWPVLHEISPLINLVEKGNNLRQELSRVQVMFDCDWAQAASAVVVQDYHSQPNLYDLVPVDLESLGNWMLQAPGFYKNTTQRARVLAQADRIFAVAEQMAKDGGGARLPMLRRPAASGRMYYGGINLQNCSPAVRHAALGAHFSYDLRRSVFSWQISVLRLILPSLNEWGHPPGTLHTREFMADRDRVTERLQPCFRHSLYTPDQIRRIIKQAITAIGFGARRTGGYVNEQTNEFVPKGIAAIIKHNPSRAEFMRNPWVLEFIKEQDQIMDWITQWALEEDPSWREDSRTWDNKNKFSKKVFVSHLYQSAEARVMQDLMATYANTQVLLWVHDGFCTRHRLPLADACARMQYQHHMKDWILEETRHPGWQDPAAPGLSPEQQQRANEAQDTQEREQRHSTEIEMWRARGHAVSEVVNQPLPQIPLKKHQAGHYSDGVSAYDAGLDPRAQASTGSLNERQFIDRIYGKY